MATKTAKSNEKATATKATASKTSTAKTSTAKSTAKTSTAKPAAKAKTAKAEPKVKETKVRKARTATENVAPVIANIMGLINDPNTSVEDLKSFRLELRKAVKATRAVVNSRKAVSTTSSK